MSVDLTYCYRLGFDTFAGIPQGGMEDVAVGVHAVFGVAMQSSADRRAGASAGPTAIREAAAEWVMPYRNQGDGAMVNLHTGEQTQLAHQSMVIDLGDVQGCELAGPGPLARVEELTAAIDARSGVPVLLGGDRVLQGALLRGLVRRDRRLAFVMLTNTLDACGDLFVPGTRLDACLRESVVVGLNGFQNERSWRRLREADVEQFPAEHIHESGLSQIQHAMRQLNQSGCAVCVLVDLEVVDSGFAAGTPGVDIGGLTPALFLALIDCLATIENLAGLAVVNCAPSLDARGHSEHLAAQALLKILGAVMFERAGG